MSIVQRIADSQKVQRNKSASFVVGSNATNKALNDFFAVLPEHYRKKAIANIYIKYLRRIQGDIKSRIRSTFKDQTGRLEQSVVVKYLKPRGSNDGPAAMVYMSNVRSVKDIYNIKTRRISKGAAARYAYAQEYGTSVAGRRRNAKIKPKPYFRPVIDQHQPSAERVILNELAKSGKREWERQARVFNKKGGTIKIKA